ncbi:hypothetical protein K438DRAFT_1774312 [Mycena galopus ATCC 62051]|nr:hypothetical protein K438DRAFT_1774312 [Mycena galopus ATCC 62051]
MSSVPRKRPTAERPKDNDSASESTDKEIPLVVQQHKFWHSFGDEGPGRDLITFALRARSLVPAIRRRALAVALKEGLSFFCLAVSTLDPSADVPQDITLCLVGVGRLIENSPDPVPLNWKEFLFPEVDEDQTPRYPANIEPPTSTNAPSLVDLENAPHLTMTKAVPPPRANAKPRSKPTLSLPWTPPPASPRLAPATSLSPRRVPSPGSNLRNRQKQAAKLLSTLPQIETKLHQFGNSKREIGWAAFPVDKFIVSISVSKKQGTTVPHPRSHLGTKDFHRNTTDYDVEALAALPPIELEPVRLLDVATAVQPLIGCTPCNLLRLKCQPNGLGISCQSCSFKKLGALCDHNMDSARFAGLMHDLTDKAAVFLPSFDVERLKRVAEMVAAARQNFILVHGESCLHLHTFFCAIRHQADVLGAEGFRTLFSGVKEGEDAASAFNTLIELYNARYPKPGQGTKSKVDDDQDAIGELDLLPPTGAPDNDLVDYPSDDEVSLAPAAKPASRSATKPPKKQGTSGSG